jgi:hypothetical protein
MVSRIRAELLKELRRGPGSVDELIERTNNGRRSVQRRIVELAVNGDIGFNVERLKNGGIKRVYYLERVRRL